VSKWPYIRVYSHYEFPQLVFVLRRCPKYTVQTLPIVCNSRTKYFPHHFEKACNRSRLQYFTPCPPCMSTTRGWMKEAGITELLSAYFLGNYIVLQVLADHERPTQIYRTTVQYLRSNYILHTHEQSSVRSRRRRDTGIPPNTAIGKRTYRTNAAIVQCTNFTNITESQDSQLGCLLDRALGI
jgi:hypothetical protein